MVVMQDSYHQVSLLILVWAIQRVHTLSIAGIASYCVKHFALPNACTK